MTEQRGAQRWRTYLGAQIAFNHRQSVMDCLVRNRSSTGARIEIVNSVPIPGTFDLTIHREGTSQVAQLAWRTETALGVVFLPPANGDVVSLNAAKRIRALQADRNRLERRIAQLTEPA